MGAIANRLGIRITDGCLFPYTDLTAKQSDMRPWNGPMTPDWTEDTRALRAKRLKFLEDDRGGIARNVERGKPFSIATADKEELLEYVANEYGTTLDARMPILILRRQALALASKQLEEMEAAEAGKTPAQEPAATLESAPVTVEVVEPKPGTRGLGRRAA